MAVFSLLFFSGQRSAFFFSSCVSKLGGVRDLLRHLRSDFEDRIFQFGYFSATRAAFLCRRVIFGDLSSSSYCQVQKMALTPTTLPMFLESLKLDASNFTLWKVKVKSTLVGVKLWDWLADVANAQSPTLVTPMTQADVDQWWSNNRQVYSFLMLKCQDATLSHVQSADIVHEVWKILGDTYKVKTMGRIIALQKDLHNLSFVACTSLNSKRAHN